MTEKEAILRLIALARAYVDGLKDEYYDEDGFQAWQNADNDFDAAVAVLVRTGMVDE